MFRTLYAMLDSGPGQQAADSLFVAHPSELVNYLEAYWDWSPVRGVRWPRLLPRPTAYLDPDPAGYVPGYIPQGGDWDFHLVYAYMVENTRIEQIFRKVIREFTHGEDLGVASGDALAWLRATETLFYRSSPPDSIWGVDSHLRPDHAAIRRNAYFRRFGMDLNHGTEDNGPYPYVKATVSNRDFVQVFESLLRETWIAIRYRTATMTENPTDDGGIADHITRLCSMLNDRSQNGTMTREEFYAVAMMSWLHMAIEHDSPIVLALNATATSPAERLRKVGARVGMAPHSKAYDYLAMADDIEDVLLAIESGVYNDATAVQQFYSVLFFNQLQSVITHWSSATGRSLKGTAIYAQTQAQTRARATAGVLN